MAKPLFTTEQIIASGENLEAQTPGKPVEAWEVFSELGARGKFDRVREIWEDRHPARLTEQELSFHRSQDIIEIDLDGEKLIYSRMTEEQPVLSGLHAPSEADLEASLVQWLERECRVADIPQSEMLPWIAAVVADLVTNREVSIRTLIDWQHQIAARIRWKIQAIRDEERTRAHQMALLDEEAKPTWSESRVVRFDDTIYQNVPTQTIGAFRFNRHLLGADRAPLIDGDLNGEEFQCAWSLDSLEEVEVWVRNVSRHRDSFSLPRIGRRFFSDFVAKLRDGRLFVVEYKGEHLIGAPEAREKSAIGIIWARTTGNVFLMVQKVAHGVEMSDQMRNALAR